MKSGKRCVSALLAMLLALSLAACGGESLGQKLEQSTLPAGTEPVETKKESLAQNSTAPAETEPGEEALEMLRWCMEPAPRIALAIAYLGNRSGEDTMPLADWLWETNPGLMTKMPFIGQIPEERILGGGYGDLYCLVPRDDSTTLAVNCVRWGGDPEPEVEEVLYRSEYAQPVLVYVWYEMRLDQPIVQIQATAGNGAQVTWLPTFDPDYGTIVLPTDENDDPLILDFSLFGFLEEEGNDMEDWDFGDDGWLPPTDEGLADTSWACEEWSMDLQRGSADPEFFGTALLYHWSGDGEETPPAWQGVWRMEDDCLRLEISAEAGDGVCGSFPVLVDPSGEHLFIQQADDGTCPPFFDEDMTAMELTFSYG